MNGVEFNERIIFLIQSPDNMQEFADLASQEENRRRIDKSIDVPGHIGVKQEDCPFCFEPIRLIFDKFSSVNCDFKLTCPNCKSSLISKFKYTDYTSNITLVEE
ncbi:MAG: hypothetical protein KKF62_18605 [Bacteroidetes bacterium]|nr:hypothetical protein [Bacteroidota bacterium]MBU1114395.1 hypothetical protein [Bacteroidota bacterium]MBU1798310.1 hypothetical protein [Bacteroidota bacterium]